MYVGREIVKEHDSALVYINQNSEFEFSWSDILEFTFIDEEENDGTNHYAEMLVDDLVADKRLSK